MTTFIFEIDIKVVRTLGEVKTPIKVREDYARVALARRIAMGMNVNENITIVSVKKK